MRMIITIKTLDSKGNMAASFRTVPQVFQEFLLNSEAL